MLKLLFWASVWVGRPVGGLRPRRIVHWLARKAYGGAKPERRAFRVWRDRYGNRLWLHPHYFIDYQVIAFGAYDAPLHRLLKQVVKPGMVCLDVGANIGCVTTHLGRLVAPSGMVFGFEPVPHLFQRLSGNVAASGCAPNTSLHDLALSRECGATTIRVADQDCDNQGMGSLRNTDHPELKATLHIRTVTLDQFVRDRRLKRLDLIKMDVQGAEPWVIEGSVETLRRFHPRLLLEVSPYDLHSFGKTPADLLGTLEALGYEFHRVERSGRIGVRLPGSSLPSDFSTDNLYCEPTGATAR